MASLRNLIGAQPKLPDERSHDDGPIQEIGIESLGDRRLNRADHPDGGVPVDHLTDLAS